VDKFEKFMRQIDILKPEVCDVPINIIGAGATGSFTTLSLAKMGFENIRVFDKDTIEVHNFPNQLFPLACLGRNKATALKELVESFTGAKIEAVEDFYTDHELSGIVICAVDTMSARESILANCQKNPKVKILIDPRCGAEVVQMLTVDMSIIQMIDWYKTTLFKDEEADPSPCTARSIIYSVLVVSAFIAKQFKLVQMNQEYQKEIIIDLKNNILQRT